MALRQSFGNWLYEELVLNKWPKPEGPPTKIDEWYQHRLNESKRIRRLLDKLLSI